MITDNLKLNDFESFDRYLFGDEDVDWEKRRLDIHSAYIAAHF